MPQMPAAPEVACKAMRRKDSAFSLLELLVVLAIIGIIAGLSLTGLGGFGKALSTDAAAQQLVEDLNLARARAINGRTTVHVVFVSTNIQSMSFGAADAQTMGNSLLDAPFRTYGFFAERRVGDQPGRPYPYYMDDWRTLPDGIIISTKEFQLVPPQVWATMEADLRPLESILIPFPTRDALTNRVYHVAFGPEGNLVDSQGQRLFGKEIIRLMEASIFAQRGPQGNLLYYDVREKPGGSNLGSGSAVEVRIDGFTGRAEIWHPTIK